MNAKSKFNINLGSDVQYSSIDDNTENQSDESGSSHSENMSVLNKK